MPPCAMRSGVSDEARSMRILAAASSSSASRGRGRAGLAGSARSCSFGGAGGVSSSTGSRKSVRENLRRDEIRALRGLANEMFGLDGPGLEAMLANGTISEVNCDGQGIQERGAGGSA